MVATFVLRLWSASRWSWYADDWIYMHDASVDSFLPYVLQVYHGHFMPGQFAIVWVLNGMAPLDHGLIVFLTAAWAATLTVVWAIALRELWGPGPVTGMVLLLVSLSPLLVLPTMWWAAALQTFVLLNCLAVCLYYVARLANTGGAQGAVGLVVTYAVGLVMWEKAVLLVLPVVVILLHATPGLLRESVRRYRRVLGWLAGLSVGYMLVFLLAAGLAPEDAEGAVRLELGRSPGEIGGFFYDLWADLLAPGVMGGPWATLPTAREFDSRPGAAVSVVALVVLVGLVVWLVRRDRSAWLPLAAAGLYVGAAWGSILFTSRFEATSWYRYTYERYALDAFVVLVVLLGAAARGPAVRDQPTGVPAWVAPTLTGLLAVSLGVASIAAVLRLGESSGNAWLANVERGVGDGPVTLVDRYAPDAVMEVAFWGDRAKLSYLLVPWGDRVHFHGPAAELQLVDDDGRLSGASFAAVSSVSIGPVADCGYAVVADTPQTVHPAPELFDWEWTLKVDAFTAGPGTLLVRGDKELEVALPAGLSSQLLVFTGPVDDLELQMAEGSGPACVTGLAIGNLSAAD